MKLDYFETDGQMYYEAAKARDRDNADIFTENPYKRASDADKLKAEIKHLNTIVERLDELLGKGIEQGQQPERS